MAGGELFLTDVSQEEQEGERQLLRCQDTGWVDIHASREARWHCLDVAGARPIVVLSVLKRLLNASGFTARLVWGRPDMRRGIFRTSPPPECKLARPQMLRTIDLAMLGLERPDSEPLMSRWTVSPCHAALVDWSASTEPWIHGWDAEHPALLAQLFVEWEVAGGDEGSFAELHQAIAVHGQQAVVMYLLSTRYQDLLAPMADGLAMAKENVARIEAALERLAPDEPSPPELAVHREAFEEALAEDVDTPSAFLAMFDWIREARSHRRHSVGDRDLRTMLWMLCMTPTIAPRQARVAGAARPAGG